MKNNKPVVAIFVVHYPPMGGGGIARLASTTFYGMKEHGCQLIFITVKYGDEKEFEELNDNVFIYRLSPFKIFGYKRYPVIKKDKLYKEIILKLENSNIDRIIVTTRFHLTSHIGAAFGKKNNIPTYLLECSGAPLTLNNKILDVPLRFIERMLSKIIFNKIDYFYGMSQVARKYLFETYGIQSKNSLWSCSINVEENLVKHTELNKIIITYSGRIENLKGEEQLAKAFIELVKKYENIYLNFIGTGSYLNILKKKFVHKNITYWGQQNIDMINKINNTSDISVCCTRFPDGAVPNAVLEAGAQKCAVVCSPNGGFLELINDGINGIFTDETVSVPSMIKSLEKLIVDKTLREKLADNIFDDIKKHYNVIVVSSRIIKDLELTIKI
jgi:glycosyltransferase involved in cell wall biosynthesis